MRPMNIEHTIIVKLARDLGSSKFEICPLGGGAPGMSSGGIAESMIDSVDLEVGFSRSFCAIDIDVG